MNDQEKELRLAAVSDRIGFDPARTHKQIDEFLGFENAIFMYGDILHSLHGQGYDEQECFLAGMMLGWRMRELMEQDKKAQSNGNNHE